MEQINTKLLQIISITLIGFIASCNKPNFVLTRQLVISEDSSLITFPLLFTVINDSSFVINNDMTCINKYSLSDGEQINSFFIKDTSKIKLIYNESLKYLPKQNYKILYSDSIAKSKYHSKLYEIVNYYYENSNYYLFSTFLLPTIENDSLISIKKFIVLINTDENFNIKKVKTFTNLKLTTSNRTPSFFNGFIKYKNNLYSKSSIFLNNNSIDSLYPAICKFKYNFNADTISYNPTYINDVYYPKNSFVSNLSNNIISGYGSFNIFNDSLYVSVSNIIFNVDSKKIIYKSNEDLILDFYINNNKELIFVSNNIDSNQTFINKVSSEGDITTMKYTSRGKKVFQDCIYNNKVYLLTKDKEHYYVEEYSID